jgi:hypothetical protein
LQTVELAGQARVTRIMLVLADLQDFVSTHRPHGPLTAEATEPAWNGYLVTVACPCRVVFGRWVTPLDADTDLISWCRFSQAL